MFPHPRLRVLWILLLLGLGTVVPPARAQQQPVPPPPDTTGVVRDTAAPDTLAPDTVTPDTLARDTLAADTTRPPPAPDSVFDRLRTLQGYTAIEYRGESAAFRADSGVLRLRGAAEVVRGGDRLNADTITYFQDRQLVRAAGSPKIGGQAQEIEGDVLFYDLESRRAMVRGGRTSITEGATWYVRGDVTTEGAQRIYATESTFTSDDREEPQYHFEADEIKVIRNRILVGRPARLYFRNVPVFWFPFIVQDLSRGRRSGLLTPEFSVNDIVRTSSNYTREISNLGFYWAINDYLGGQLSGRWRSDSYVGLNAALQFSWRRQFLNGSFNVQRYWQDSGDDQLSLSASSSWRPNERTDLALQGSYASSSRFVRQQSVDNTETRDLSSTFSMNRRFDWGSVNLGARRSQSIADGRVEMTLPSLGLNINPITLFRASPDQARWYNNASLNLGGTASRDVSDFEEDAVSVARLLEDATRTRFQATQSLTVGNLSLSTNGSLNRELLGGIEEADTVVRLPRDRGQGEWSTSISYRQPLIASTSISPFISFGQSYRQEEQTEGEYLGGPVRMNFGVSVNPDFYGFFPGVGPYSAIRHHIKPNISYRYSPAVEQTILQDSVFGRNTGLAQNVVTLGLNQTFEAKLRTPRTRAAADTATDSTAAQVAAAEPIEAEKVKVLSINTSAIGYDFERASLGESGFIGASVTNRIDSDYLEGLSLDFTHDLFTDPVSESPNEIGDFAPHLSRLNASFSFGANSALFRRLFGLFTSPDEPEESVVPNEGVVPGTQPDPDGLGPEPASLGRRGASGPQMGGGPWNAAVSYALTRPREAADGAAALQTESQTLNGNIRFSPTANWSVNWQTSYSVTEGEFGSHTLTLRRNLYRWQADFNFRRTIYGNTSFSVSVHLIDLPDLKVDYRDRNLGGTSRR